MDFPAAKKIRFKPYTNDGTCTNLLDLPDEILLRVFSHLHSARAKLRLSETCQRLKRISADKSLWIRVDTRGQEDVEKEAPFTDNELRKMIQFLHNGTKFLSIHGRNKKLRKCTVQGPTETLILSDWRQFSLGPRRKMPPEILLFISERCPNLTELQLIDFNLDSSEVSIQMFPSSILALRMINCNVVNIPANSSFFKGVSKSMPQLKIVDLQSSEFSPGYLGLRALSKCSYIEEIDLRNCLDMSETPSGTAFASWTGFRRLKMADLRGGGSAFPHLFARVTELTFLWAGPVVEGRGNGSLFGDTEMRKLLGIARQMSEDSFYIRDRDVKVEGSKIRFLCLAYTDVTDRFMGELPACLPLLKRLDLTGTKVTGEAVGELKAALPGCEVMWKSLL